AARLRPQPRGAGARVRGRGPRRGGGGAAERRRREPTERDHGDRMALGQLSTTPAAAVCGLHTGFLRSAETFPGRPALEVDGARLTYAELRDRAASVAATLERHAC